MKFLSPPDLSANKATSVADPTAAQDAATKTYVDTAAPWKYPCTIVTTAALAACTYNNGTAGVGATLTENGNNPITMTNISFNTSPAVGSRILVKDQASNFQNGIYVVTDLGSFSSHWVLTRATDFDTPAKINGALTIALGQQSFTWRHQGWAVEKDVVTVGTDEVRLAQFTGTGAISFAGGLTSVTTQASIDTAWTGQTAITTVGTISTGTWGATTIAVNKGGTGATTAAGALANLGAVGTVTAGDSTVTVGGTATNPSVAVAKVLDHTWVTDFDAEVRLSRLDQMAAPTADVSMNTHKITSVTDPSNPQDAATKAYTDAGDTAVTAAVEAWVALNYGQPPSDLQAGTQWDLAQYAQSMFGIPIRLEAGATMTLAAGSMLVGK